MVERKKSGTIKETQAPADLEALLHRAHLTYGNRSNFCGVDIGYRWRQGRCLDEICLRLHVTSKLPLHALLPSQVFPSQLDGVALDVIEARYHPSLEPETARKSTTRQPYTMGGLSCCRSGEGIGTIGLVVIDTTTGKPGILSNWHVLAGPRARRNDPILQPAERDSDFDPRDRVARLKRWVLDRSGDAALAELLPDQPWLPLQFASFQNLRRVRHARLGEILNKTNRRASTIQARVDGEGLYRLRYETRPGVFEFRDIAGFKLVSEGGTPVQSDKMSSAGDSGAAWISANSEAAVGLQFGGQMPSGMPSEYAYQGSIACAIPTVFEKLQLRLATFEDLMAQNDPDAVRTPRQKAHAALFSPSGSGSTMPAELPHPRLWQDSLRNTPPTEPRDKRTGERLPLGDIVPLVRILPSGRVPASSLDSQMPPSRRQDIVQDLWSERLYPALMDYDRNFKGVYLDEAIAQRISAVDSRSLDAFFTRLINSSVHFNGLGVKQVQDSDFEGVLTYMQVCERIDALRVTL